MSSQKEYYIPPQPSPEDLRRQKEAEEQVRKEAEEREARLRREREEAERREAEAKQRILNQLSGFEKQVESFGRNIEKVNRQIESASSRLGNMSTGLETIQQKSAELQNEFLQIHSKIATLSAQNDLTAEQIVYLEESLRISTAKSEKLVADWQVTFNNARNLGKLSSDTLDQLNELKGDFISVSAGLGSFTDYIRRTENVLGGFRKDYQDLSEAHRCAVGEINLLKNRSVVNSAAFFEIYALRKQGYQLKSIISGEETDLFFQDQEGKKRLGLKIKRVASPEGLQWLRDLDIGGFEKRELEELLTENRDLLQAFGIEYIQTTKKFPPHPPSLPEAPAEWERIVMKNKHPG